MIKNFNGEFFRSIVQSEFLHKNSLHKEKSFKQLVLKNPSFYVANVFSLAKELKQLIRVLDFLSSKAPKNHLYLLIQNKVQYYLLNRYFVNSIINTTKITFVKGYLFRKSARLSSMNMLISFINFNAKYLNRITFSNNIFLLGLIYFSSRLLKINNFYRVTNKLDNNKKLFFIVSLLEHVFNKTKN